MGDRILLVSERPPIHCNSARRLAEEGDLLWISAKCCYIITHPFNSKSLVAQTEVLGDAWGAWEAEDIEAVGQSDNHRASIGSKLLAIVEW